MSSRSRLSSGDLTGIVKIHCEGAAPSYTAPWHIEEQVMWTGSGFDVCLEGRRQLILTNAHVVENAFIIQISRQDRPKKIRAKLVCLAPDVDLALVSSEDADAVPAENILSISARLPALFDSVSAMGFPSGGNAICATRGVVSRIDAHLYAHLEAKGFQENCAGTPGNLLILQIDAAINNGNSGGPALDDDGLVVGVASSALNSAQNVGYVIPAIILQLFMKEFATTGKWSGVCELGFGYRRLENEALHASLRGPKDCGVLVTSVAPLGPAIGVLREGDVLYGINELSINVDGSICWKQKKGTSILLPLDHWFTSAAPGTDLNLAVSRGGEQMQIAYVTGSVQPLLPRYCGVDARPSFAIFGGLVFTRLSMPLFSELLQSIEEEPLQKCHLLSDVQRWRQHSEDEIVLLQQILRHDINVGIEECCTWQRVTHVNETPISSLVQLVQEATRLLKQHMRNKNPQFMRFRFDSRGQNGTCNRSSHEILPLAMIVEADAEILKQNSIPAPVSADLFEHYRETAPDHDSTVQAWLVCLQSMQPRCMRPQKRARPMSV